MKRIIAALVILVAMCTGISITYSNESAAPQPVIYADIEPINITVTCPTKETTEPEETTAYRYIKSCPLSMEMQQYIFDTCYKYSVSYELVMAVIERESLYNADEVGDNGNSVGLMQIQERYNRELMQELGVTDLYNPMQNVEVGVALLQRYFEKYEDIYTVLMAYNGGESYAKRMVKAGKRSNYAKEIIERAAAFEIESGVLHE